MDLGQRAVPMSVEQNISFYEEQFNCFRPYNQCEELPSMPREPKLLQCAKS